MSYLYATEREQEQMLEAIGVASIDDLFESIPPEVRLERELDLPPACSEMELQTELQKVCQQSNRAVCFLGGGAYDHFIPSTVDEICSRGEYYTAYTPYQPEASQGTLQAFFEFQSLVSELFGLDVANASLYDGASALAEAVAMAFRCLPKRRKVVVSPGVHPEYLLTLKTYLEQIKCEIVELDLIDGVTDWAGSTDEIDDQTAAVVVQHPNFFGCLEDVPEPVRYAHDAGALVISVADPSSLGVLQRPGDYGVDIAVAEGQSLGIPLQFGGPYLGLLACRQDYVRKMPGRLIGRTVDQDGKQSFVLNFQTREQHIRRDKATSNICTNQGLMALRALVYLAQMGPQGMVELGELCCRKANYLAQRLTEAGLGQMAFPHPIFKEFTFQFRQPVETVIKVAREAGFAIGPELSRFEWNTSVPENSLLIAVTEQRTREEIDQLVAALSSQQSQGE